MNNYEIETNDQFVDSITEYVARLRKGEREAAAEDYAYAVRLATVLRGHFYPDNEDWQPLETINGVLSQIDNMIAGLLKRSEKPARSFKIEEATGPF